MTDIVEQFDNMVGHIVSINDERDITTLLLSLKDMWPKVHDEIKRLRLAASREMATLTDRIEARIRKIPASNPGYISVRTDGTLEDLLDDNLLRRIAEVAADEALKVAPLVSQK